MALYPEIEPFDKGHLNVSALHAIYYEQSGNPKGVPVVFLHGGPGAGTGPKQRQFFDPKHYRIILFDQRGAGLSTPLGELRENTTEDLVADIERLRQHFGIERWHVFGGSWGSTLALCYAIAHPDKVLSLCLRGIFTMRKEETEWFLRGIKTFFPDAWETFAGHIPADEQHDLLKAYHKRLTDPDPHVHLPAARVWSSYEISCVRLIPEPMPPRTEEDDHHAYAIARIECHYFVNNAFSPDDYILRNIGKIRHIPAVIVQGRYDVVCPPETAYALHQKWDRAKFVMVPDAGHASSEPGTQAALVAAMDAFRAI